MHYVFTDVSRLVNRRLCNGYILKHTTVAPLGDGVMGTEVDRYLKFSEGMSPNLTGGGAFVGG